MTPAHPAIPAAAVSAVPRRCPECGTEQSSKPRARPGFWGDPSRWIPALLVCLMIGFQVATPWVLAHRRYSMRVPGASGGSRGESIMALQLTREGLRRAAETDGREQRRIEAFLGEFTKDWHPTALGAMDPAALLVIGLWSEDPSVPKPEYQSRLILGYPVSWLSIGDSSFDFDHQQITAARVDWTSLNANRPGWRTSLGIEFDTLVFLVVATCAMTWAASRLLRPHRTGSKIRALREHWWAAAIALTAVAVAYPHPISTDSYRGFSDEDQAKSVYDPKAYVSTKVTLHEIRTLAAGDDGATRVAKLLNERFYAVRQYLARMGAAKPTDRITIGWRPQTISGSHSFLFGWPAHVTTLAVWEKPAPIGVPAVLDSTWHANFHLTGGRLALNKGVWPGTSVDMWFNTSGMVYNATAIFIAWWLARAILNSGLFFRARRRAAKGLCTACGYDLRTLPSRA
ncbi:MAG: hypothetical protein ACKVZJ_04525 [Phycisphaerales bacterium]